jgi:hypothetical protein
MAPANPVDRLTPGGVGRVTDRHAPLAVLLGACKGAEILDSLSADGWRRPVGAYWKGCPGRPACLPGRRIEIGVPDADPGYDIGHQ